MPSSGFFAHLAPILLDQRQTSQTFNTPIPCCSVAASSVPADSRSSWCEANLDICVDLCGGQGRIASNGNTCDTTSLQFSCKCSNGTDAGKAMTAYQQSVPGQMCRFWYTTCLSASGQNAQQQNECRNAELATCGNLTVDQSIPISSVLLPVSITSSRTSSSSKFSTTSTISQSTGVSSSFSFSLSSSSSSSSAAAASDTPSSNEPSMGKSGTSNGTIAGAVVGGLAGVIILAVLLWLCLRRQRAKQHVALTAGDTGPGSDEKQVTDVTSTPLPFKPELHGDASVIPGTGPRTQDYNTTATPNNHYGGASELHASPNQGRHELYSVSPQHAYYQDANIHNDGPHNYAELHAGTAPSELYTSVPPYAEAPASPYHALSSSQFDQQPRNNAQELYPRSPVPSRKELPRQLSAEEITALEEEERRIDTEMEEVRRMKELRDQKIAIQQRLRDAKGT